VVFGQDQREKDTYLCLPDCDSAGVLSASCDPHDESVKHQGDKPDLHGWDERVTVSMGFEMVHKLEDN
jgi:hypothetical protein